MSETPGEAYLEPTGMYLLFTALTNGASVLDQTGAGAPGAPDAGVSTPLVGDLLAGMSGAVGDLVTALDLTAASVRYSDETFGSADQNGALLFRAPGE